MLTPTMTPTEVNTEIFSDWEVVQTSIKRMSQEYDKMRRRKKIPKDHVYPVAKEIKSKKKNTWIFIFCKQPNKEKYNGIDSINVCNLIYYYTEKGLRVFKIRPVINLDVPLKRESFGISVYNGHLFSRYDERLNLGLELPLDKVKHFFSHNGYSMAGHMMQDGKEIIVAICRDGFLLGDTKLGGSWLVYKTFISKNEAKTDQFQIQAGLLEIMQRNFDATINDPNSNPITLGYIKDGIEGIKR